MVYSLFSYSICSKKRYKSVYYDTASNLGSYNSYEDIINTSKDYFTKCISNKYNEYTLNSQSKKGADQDLLTYEQFSSLYNIQYYTIQNNNPVNLVAKLSSVNKKNRDFEVINIYSFNSTSGMSE